MRIATKNVIQQMDAAARIKATVRMLSKPLICQHCYEPYSRNNHKVICETCHQQRCQTCCKPRLDGTRTCCAPEE